jgi:hypothetical protein
MIWFYTLCVTAIAIVIADANGTLEPAVNKFEEKIGIRTELPADTTDFDLNIEDFEIDVQRN